MHDTQQLGNSLYEVTLTKGQIISEQICGVLKFSKKNNEIIQCMLQYPNKILSTSIGNILKYHYQYGF